MSVCIRACARASVRVYVRVRVRARARARARARMCMRACARMRVYGRPSAGQPSAGPSHPSPANSTFLTLLLKAAGALRARENSLFFDTQIFAWIFVSFYLREFV